MASYNRSVTKKEIRESIKRGREVAEKREPYFIRVKKAKIKKAKLIMTFENGIILGCPLSLLGPEYSEEKLKGEVEIEYDGNVLSFPHNDMIGGHVEFLVRNICNLIPGITAQHFFMTEAGAGLGG